MKKSLLLAASVSAAATATATATISSVSKVRISLRKDDNLEKKDENCSKSVKASTSTDKFAPRFDGLRFIETLVTAHR
ncbi:uncharacterized protein LOC125878035 [Solanum stenotomum]|uniref:uncharacterized protein LOC125878035 n=1 Tax=Solanum stenotomum TaxID=172797 RepID=UPI0020D0AAF1|nr:uncharacterized protein LOC125878035 [Solanum stenotomum]